MKGYKAYLFDFDYTLADSSRGIVKCYRNVLNRHGFTSVSDDEIKRTIGKTLEESFSIFTGSHDSVFLASLKKEYVAEADRIMTDNTILFPETINVLSTLKASGAKTGIISTKYRYRIKECLDRNLIGDIADIIIGGEDVKQPKPSPEGLELAIARLDIGKSDVLYIGDSTVDAETARRASVDFAGVLNGVTTAAELSGYPHVGIMDNLNELLQSHT